MTQEKRHVIVAGGGAAGMAAAIAAARSGCRVSLYEKNEKFVVCIINHDYFPW